MEEDDRESLLTAPLSEAGRGGKGRESGGIPAFLMKTYQILSTPAYDRYIRWSENGLAIQIVDAAGFSDVVLPRHFKHNNITSFIRQLNMYSFTKTRHDANWREFHHPCFRRGRPDLLCNIKRKTNALPAVSRSGAGEKLISPAGFEYEEEWGQGVDTASYDERSVPELGVAPQGGGFGVDKHFPPPPLISPALASAVANVSFDSIQDPIARLPLSPVVKALGVCHSNPSTLNPEDLARWMNAVGLQSPTASLPGSDHALSSDELGSRGAGAMPEPGSLLNGASDFRAPPSVLLRGVTSSSARDAMLLRAAEVLDAQSGVGPGPCAPDSTFLGVPLDEAKEAQGKDDVSELRARVKTLEDQLSATLLIIQRLTASSGAATLIASVLNNLLVRNASESTTNVEAPAAAKRRRLEAEGSPETAFSSQDGSHEPVALAALAQIGADLMDNGEGSFPDPAGRRRGRRVGPPSGRHSMGGAPLESIVPLASRAPGTIASSQTAGQSVFAMAQSDPSPRMAATAFISQGRASNIPAPANNPAATIAAKAVAASSAANMMRISELLNTYQLTAQPSADAVGGASRP